MTWAALLPCRLLQQGQQLSSACFPARVAKNVTKNKSTRGVRPDRTTDFVQAPVQKVISKQIMPPHAAPPTVAARNLRAIKANATLNTNKSSTKAGNRTPNLAAARSASAHNHTSNAPTTPTSTRDCNRPVPPELPSSSPYLPRLLAFPHPSPNLSPRSDLQSNLEHSQHQHQRGSSLHLARIKQKQTPSRGPTGAPFSP